MANHKHRPARPCSDCKWLLLKIAAVDKVLDYEAADLDPIVLLKLREALKTGKSYAGEKKQ